MNISNEKKKCICLIAVLFIIGNILCQKMKKPFLYSFSTFRDENVLVTNKGKAMYVYWLR